MSGIGTRFGTQGLSIAPHRGTSTTTAEFPAPQGTVRPLARLLEHELTARLDTTVKLRFDGDPLDMQARAATFKALVAGGVAVNEALTTAGLLTDD